MTTPFPTYSEDYDFSTNDREITREQALALSTDDVHRPIWTTEVEENTQADQTHTPPVVDLSDDELQRDLELALETSDEGEEEDEEKEDKKMEDEESDFDFGESDDGTDDEPSILYACRHCAEDDRNCYSLVENLHNHIRLDHGLDLIACSFCPEDSLESDEDRQNHVRIVHGLVSCPQCGKFLKKTDLKEHLDNTCRPTADSMISCPKCGKVLKKRSLKNHLENPKACRPTADIRISCPKCGKVLKKKSLKPHLENPKACRPGHTPKPKTPSPRRSSTTRQTPSPIPKKRASTVFKAERAQFLEKLATDPASLKAEQQRLFQQSSSALSPSGSPGGIDGIARFNVRPRVGSTSPSPADREHSSPLFSATA